MNTQATDMKKKLPMIKKQAGFGFAIHLLVIWIGTVACIGTAEHLLG